MKPSLFTQIDPFYLLLRYLVLRRFFSVQLSKGEELFVKNNIDKHRTIYWVAVLCIFLIFPSISELDQAVKVGLLTGLLGPVFILGGAWFAVSFGGIPTKLLQVAMSVTFWMYLAFKVSFVTMVVALIAVTPESLWIIWILIAVSTFFACEQYDTADGLKSGLDEALLKHSRAALTYYAQQGIQPEKED